MRDRDIGKQLANLSCDGAETRPVGHSTDGPAISCVMVTRGRVQDATASIKAYARQTYANRQLIVVSEDDHESAAFTALVEQLGESNVHIVRPPSADLDPADAFRFGARYATGELVCRWGDFELSHPLRLAAQVSYLLDADAQLSFLCDHLHYVPDDAALYWCDWLAPADGCEWPSFNRNTILCYTGLAEESAAMTPSVIGSDPRAIGVTGLGWLYLSVGRRTEPPSSADRELLQATAVEIEKLVPRRDLLADALAGYDFAGAVEVRGRDERVAFVVSETDAGHDARD
jgi:hypothetical protein